MWNERCLRTCIVLLVAAISPGIALCDDIDIRGIDFKAGLPVADSHLTDVVAEPSHDSIAILEQDAAVLREFPKLRVKIVGFTDNQECHEIACAELSRRRAKYVRDWFLSDGIPSQQLDGPEGHGSAEPIDNNATERGRARNRRAEVQILTDLNGKAVSLP
jgi:OmpA-OmpF porin, OOP family